MAVPGIVVLALGAGALGGTDALRLLIALAGRNPVVDIGICVFVIGIFVAQLLGILLLVRYVRKPPLPPPAGGAAAGRASGAPGAAPDADPLACVTLLLSLAAAFLVTACLIVVSDGPGSVRPLVDLATKYCYPIVMAAAAGGAALRYATPLLRVFRESRNARGPAATTRHALRFIGLPVVVAAACALIVAIPFGARGGLDVLRLSPGYDNTPVVTAFLVVVAGVPASVRPLVDLAAKYCYPIVMAAAGAALLYAMPLLRVFREPRNARGPAAPAERAATTRHAARFIGLPLVAAAAACAVIVGIQFGARGGLDGLRLSPGYTNTPVAVAVGA